MRTQAFFRKNTEDLTKNKIFFAVGDPLVISAPRSFFHKCQNWFFGVGYDVLCINFRSSIPKEEIKQSFPKSGTIKLFLSEGDALIYARSLRKIVKAESDNHEADTYYQPAIFTVKCLISIKQALITEKISIDQNSESDCLNGTYEVAFFYVDREDITPQYCMVKVENDYIRDEEGKVTNRVNYREYPGGIFEKNNESYSTYRP